MGLRLLGRDVHYEPWVFELKSSYIYIVLELRSSPHFGRHYRVRAQSREHSPAFAYANVLPPTRAENAIGNGPDYSSFSFCLISSVGPLPLESCPTAPGPPTREKAWWKTHSVACSTGASNMNGNAGTAARPKPIGPQVLIVVFFAFFSARPEYRTML